VRFLARLHGQCEVHGWVAGKNRAWLADIIETGRETAILRDDMGWREWSPSCGSPIAVKS
jgi:hypothetical protein